MVQPPIGTLCYGNLGNLLLGNVSFEYCKLVHDKHEFVRLENVNPENICLVGF